jgi:serine/threonine protein kinase
MYIRGKIIGKGAFGEVYECYHIDTKVKYAIKYDKVTEYGIRNFNELYIMSTFRHIHLMHAIYINCDSDSIYTVMPIGTSDFSKLCRIDKKGTPMSLENTKYFGWQITTAIAELHSQGIVHADVKLNNIIMVDNRAVLSDFGLSLRKDSRNRFNYNIGTPTHRPPEMWSGDSWNESIDVWAFGCALYEMLFGELPIPEQRDLYSSEIEKRKYLKCIQNFCASLPNHYKSYEILPPSRKTRSRLDNVDIRLPSSKISTLLSDPGLVTTNRSMAFACDLIVRMMNYDPNRRLKISEVLGHQFFTGNVLPRAQYFQMPKVNTEDITKELSKYTSSDATIDLANRIYSKLSLTTISRNRPLYIVACFVIACRLRNMALDKPEKLANGIGLAAICAAQRNIVTEISFCFFDRRE